jgi:phosphoenolpyruvate carboxykinase (ATP)
MTPSSPRRATVSADQPPLAPDLLSSLGIVGARTVHNPSVPELYAHALRLGEGVMTEGGPLAVVTDKTGRRPKDRFIVEDDLTRDSVWWGGFNTPVSPEVFAHLRARMADYAAGRELFVQDVCAGADPRYRLPVRFVQEMAYHSLFVRNLFIEPESFTEPSTAEHEQFEPA